MMNRAILTMIITAAAILLMAATYLISPVLACGCPCPEGTVEDSVRGYQWCNKGIEFKHAGNYELAASCYIKAVEAGPNSVMIEWVYTYICKCLNLLGRYDEAIEWANKGINYCPLSANFYLHRGYAYEMLGDKEKALGSYKSGCGIIDCASQSCVYYDRLKTSTEKTPNKTY